MNTPARLLLDIPRVLVIAHRGYSGIAPENTLPAFELALASGADLIELDYRHSADGTLVVIHDATLDRTTDAGVLPPSRQLEVASRTDEELSLLDAGSWFSPRYITSHIPTLRQSLDLIQRGATALIEHKAGSAQALIELLRDEKVLEHVIVQSFDWDFLHDCHQAAPELTLGALGPPPGQTLSAKLLDEIHSVGASIVVWNSHLTHRAIQEAHQRGLKVWVYTVNDIATAQKLVALGVDGIISDHPPLIWKALATRTV